MALAGITLVCGIIRLFLIHNQGVSATCVADGNELVTVINSREVDVITNLPVVPHCIRCAATTNTPPFIEFFTDPNDVSYLHDENQLVNGTISNVTIFNDGLLVEDPASSFNNGDSIECEFDDGTNSGSRTITFVIGAFLPPPITPNGTVLDYVEGDNVTLTCTGNSILSDRYQWTLPDGSTGTPNPVIADDGLDLELKNVNRTDSGVYNCTGTVSGTTVSVVSSVTLNIQYPARVLSLVGNSAKLSIGLLLTLNCSFEGNPTPTISWSHNGSIIPSNNITDNYAILEIALDSSQSFGEYTCSVNNTIYNTAVSDFMQTYSIYVSEPDSSTSSTTSTTVSIHDETTAITTSTTTNVCDETCVTTVFSTPSSKRIMPSSSASDQPTIISELQNGSLPSYGVILIVLLSIISVLSITINIVIILVVWYWKRTDKTTSKSSTSATAAIASNSNDVMVDDNSAYGMRDTRLIREQQTTGNEVIYEPL